MDAVILRDGASEVEVRPFETGTGVRLRITATADGRSLDLDPLELEGLTRLPYTTLPGIALSARSADVAPPPVGRPASAIEVLRNEFALVEVRVAGGPDGPGLWIRSMISGAEVALRPTDLERLSALRHRDLSPLIDPSGMVVTEEPDPDQV